MTPESPRTVIAVPARYGSTRLPGKALADIGGEPMVLRVWKRCRAVAGAERVIVATDDERIAAALRPAGAEVRMTSADHRTGTDRIAEAVADIECDVVVNVQGDEPFLEPSAVEALISYFAGGGNAPVATLATPVLDRAELFDPAAVKVVVDRRGRALYFSRLPVPYRGELWASGEGGLAPILGGAVDREWGYLRHIGVYAYRAGYLRRFTSLERTAAEDAEGLEQLRVLEHGEGLQVVVRQTSSFGVDTPADLERARKIAEREAL